MVTAPVYLVLASEADALAARAEIARALGYPRPAAPTGDGRHAPGAETRFYSDPIRHPDGTRWAIVVDAVTAAILPQVRAALPTLADPVTLDASWFPTWT